MNKRPLIVIATVIALLLPFIYAVPAASQTQPPGVGQIEALQTAVAEIRGTLAAPTIAPATPTTVASTATSVPATPTAQPTTAPTTAPTIAPSATFAPTLTPGPTTAPATPTALPSPTAQPATATPVANDIIGAPVVFVSRQIPPDGSIYMPSANDLPGAGARSRVRVASPGRLMVRETTGATRILVDGSSASSPIVDVNAPSVSYDGRTVIFSGLPRGNYSRDPALYTPNAWRIYAINADGTGLRQVSKSGEQPSLVGTGLPGGLVGYDDYDPVFLPDGRIAFASTRYPSFGQYGGVRTSNIYVMRADGTGVRRVTTERNGADRPVVDPLTGKIVYSRWWRNHRFPLDNISTSNVAPGGGIARRDGLTAERNDPLGELMWRNAWQLDTINPDGTDLGKWNHSAQSLADVQDNGNHVYGGAFTPGGDFVGVYHPMPNMTEAAGFSGLRLHPRGFGAVRPIIGVPYLTGDYVQANSFGIFKSATGYWAEPYVLPDGRILASRAADTRQDYDLYVVNADGTNPQRVLGFAGTTELRAQVLAARTLPPVIVDRNTTVASPLPPPNNNITRDGTFVFQDLNIYANAPVDTDIENAPAVGSAASIRFFADHQRTSPGSFPYQDWPVLLTETQVSAAGFLVNSAAPANVPLFEQLRNAGRNFVPRTGDGAAHVAGMNFNPPGEIVTCVGCHTGHSLMTFDEADAQWSNLATGATVRVSSTNNAQRNGGVIDRRVRLGSVYDYWKSSQSQAQNGQWVALDFPVSVAVRGVRLWGPLRAGGAQVVVNRAVVSLYDASGTMLAQAAAANVSPDGTLAAFSNVSGVRSVRVDMPDVTGTFDGLRIASLGEVEVIAKGEQ